MDKLNKGQKKTASNIQISNHITIVVHKCKTLIWLEDGPNHDDRLSELLVWLTKIELT